MGVITKVTVGRKKKERIDPSAIADGILEEVKKEYLDLSKTVEKEAAFLQVTEDLSFAVEVSHKITEYIESFKMETPPMFNRDDVHDMEAKVESEGYYFRSDLSSKVVDSALNKLFI